MKLIYKVEDKPQFHQLVIFAFQQLLAIMAATIAVPLIIKNGMNTAAALFGAGVGTLVYVAFTRKKSPVFLGSSFAFIGSMSAAFAGATTVAAGYVGLIIGAAFAGLVYVVIALFIERIGVDWVNRIMPPVVIGPTVAIIGLSLAANAVGDLQTSSLTGARTQFAVLVGIIALLGVMIASTYGKSHAKMIPFIIGILAGYIVAAILTFIGVQTGYEPMQILNYQPIVDLFANGISFSTFFKIPDFTFITALEGIKDIDLGYIGTIAVAYIPVSFVVFAEHIADHKNISSIIERDLLKDPGLDRTLLGDGVGSMVGAFFGGCPNTTYGESVACVAITKNASVLTIIGAAIECILISFFTPFVTFISTIPACVMGGVCMALYGFIAVSGLKMVQKIDLDHNKNLFVISSILISGIGGLSLSFGKITITSVACALILGIIVNKILSKEPENTEENQ
ncbi:MAG: uracil-xanthine permease [Solobacterium sp.]|uniref:uracil-xanthine permease family protein n=1 Tax=Solobacterium sp. TaxID=2060878 RepID=UPI001CB27BB9|nr:solute carrier family 23 protein [Solobacterium sp.]MBF1089957.1 uracil-xanthine permease [Solobacterium sp.]MBF1118124.1 uracil-xanthine permease [Solobacterium sp.]